MSNAALPARALPAGAELADGASQTVIAVLEEHISVRKRVVESGGAVRVRKLVHEDAVTVDEPLAVEEVSVERVAIGRVIDSKVALRHEGDVTIVPIVEERWVATRQLVLVEEIRITRSKRIHRAPQHLTVRREEAIVERQEPATGEWRVLDTDSEPVFHLPRDPPPR